ncbi:MAG: SPOR domain-containing protein [Odoribacteraceae bacterium]|jgi:hypothetical protein|nr:SPOR domain-containing protein [Odoribacteraceae bacterium]
MHRIAFTLLLLLLAWHRGQGQIDSLSPQKVDTDFLQELLLPDLGTRGEVQIAGDPRVEQLLNLMIAVNKRRNVFPGYRVQLFSANTSRVKIDSLQRYVSRFEEQFPGVRTYLQYVDPDFKIRVGNFKTKIEAIPLLKKIRKKYPSSYIVRDMIHLKDLLVPEPEAAEEILIDPF